MKHDQLTLRMAVRPTRPDKNLSATIRQRNAAAKTKEIRMRLVTALLLAAALAASATNASAADPAAAPAADRKLTQDPNGEWRLPDGTPTYNIAPDGTLDWFTYSGFRRYHSECHVCHGPEAQGSSYAPALVDSLKTIDYTKFLGIVASGQRNVRFQGNSVMPALGDNKNVMCYIDDIYIY
ncbi:MAG: c-type cytochrome, methanol metabolism-related, partial [Gammaproteobacteria bacterium]